MGDNLSRQPNQLLRMARQQRHWSQQELADQLGTTTVTISRWENGTVQPGAHFRVKLMRIFGATAQELGLLANRAEQAAQQQTELEQAPASVVEEKSFPHFWTVPYRRNPAFTGREHILTRLHTLFQQGMESQTSLACTISGLGGMGKTQVAIEYAYRYAQEYAAIFWVHAETLEALLASFVDIATHLDLPEKETQDQHRIVSAVLKWLQNQQQWLLIFDNVEDIALLHTFLPATRSGSLLFTSRGPLSGISAQTLQLEKMTREESTRLFLQRSHILPTHNVQQQLPATDQHAMQAIITALDGLPLALDQAGAYIDSTQCNLADYLRLFQASPLRLLAERGIPLEHPLSVSRTFLLLFEQLQGQHAHATALLTLCAFLAPDTIPEAFFLEHAEILGPQMEALAQDPFLFQEVLQTLLRYALIQRNSSTHVLTIHRLLQTVILNALPAETQRLCTTRLLQALDKAFPAASERVETWQHCEQLLPHSLKIVALAEREQIAPFTAVSLLHKSAVYMYQRTRYQEAEAAQYKALELCQQTAGLDHQLGVEVLSGLVETSWFLKKIPQTTMYAQRVIALVEQNPAIPSITMMKSLNILAQIARIQRRFTDAELLLFRALTIWIRAVSNEGTPTPAYADNDHVQTVQNTEQQRREALLHQTFSLWEQRPSYLHYSLGHALAVLGQVYLEQERYAEAEAVLLPLYRIGKLALGEEHYFMSHSMLLLAETYVRQNRLAEATPYATNALSLLEQTLGTDHPRTKAARGTWTRLLKLNQAHKYDQA